MRHYNCAGSLDFRPDNLYYDKEYCRILQGYGVDVMYGVELVGNFGGWIEENGRYLDYVFLSRAHICAKYIDEIEAHSMARRIYYGHDLTFPRLQKEYELTGRAEILEEIDQWRRLETHMWRKAEVIYYPAPEEVAWVAAQAVDKTVRPFRIQVYPDEGIATARERLERKRAVVGTMGLFVGGFAHRPNADAVLWYVRDILPLVKRQLPEMTTVIAGSYPPEEVKALGRDDVLVTGHIADSVLEWFYMTTTTVIAPLRYGGGMKGKVIEAIRFGAPVVTTSCGADGFEAASEFLFIADGAEAFAAAVVRAVTDRRGAKRLVRAGLDYVSREFGYRSVARRMAADIPELQTIASGVGHLTR